ncbi:MAG: NAD(P)/FAD-dependent oxidoreductase, partial [Thermoplasmatota archaeon]
AAAQVKPTSGGGLYPGLLGAKYCASSANEAIQKQDFSTSVLQHYPEKWTKELGWEIKVGMQFRKIFNSFQDHQFNKYIKKFKEKNIEELITLHGDMDFPSKLAKPILKKMPSLIKFLPSIIVQH